MPPGAAERLRSENEPFRLLRSEDCSNGQGVSSLSLLLCRGNSREIATSHDFPGAKRMDDDAGRKAGGSDLSPAVRRSLTLPACSAP